MGAIGFAVFAIGVALAVVGGAKAPVEGSDWPDTMLLFGIGTAVSIVGLVLWHTATRKAAKEAATAGGADADPAALIASLQAPLNDLNEDIGTLNTDQICDRVDALLTGYVLPFAEVRQKVVSRFGMEKGAEILVTVAFGERLLNRVWSAAGDGHAPEARKSFPEAYSAFVEAGRLFDEAGKTA